MQLDEALSTDSLRQLLLQVVDTSQSKRLGAVRATCVAFSTVLRGTDLCLLSLSHERPKGAPAAFAVENLHDTFANLREVRLMHMHNTTRLDFASFRHLRFLGLWEVSKLQVVVLSSSLETLHISLTPLLRSVDLVGLCRLKELKLVHLHNITTLALGNLPSLRAARLVSLLQLRTLDLRGLAQKAQVRSRNLPADMFVVRPDDPGGADDQHKLRPA